MIRRRLAGVCCLLSLCYVMAGATPIAMAQISYDMSKALITLGSGDSIGSRSIATYSHVHSDDGLTVETMDLTDNGTITANVSGSAAIVFVDNGSVISNSNSTLSNGASIASTMVNSVISLDVKTVDVVSVTMDISALLDVSVDDPGFEYAFGSLDNWLVLSYFDQDENKMVSATDFSYSLLWDIDFDGIASGPINESPKLTLSYSFENTKYNGQYSGLLLIQNLALTMSEAQSHPTTNVPEPASISLMFMGLAMLLPLALRRKNK